MYSLTKHTTYIVYWPSDSIVKAGYSQRQRWRTFLGRGAVLIDLVEADDVSDAFMMEDVVESVFRKAGTRAFSSAIEAVPFLGGRGGGWKECYRLPEGLHPLEVLSTADWLNA